MPTHEKMIAHHDDGQKKLLAQYVNTEATAAASKTK